MSPIERAWAELQRLLSRNLPGKGLYKDFYVELTMVVRRYIERTHGIHAPEQTTQEFLLAAAKHPLFKREVLAQLQTFLESADLVKFAGQEATLAMAEDATQKAKRYIEDVRACQSPASQHSGLACGDCEALARALPAGGPAPHYRCRTSSHNTHA